MKKLTEAFSEAERRAWEGAPDIYCGREAICEALNLPWATIHRLATAGGLRVQDLDGPAPRLAAADWEAWRRWDAGEGVDNEQRSATA